VVIDGRGMDERCGVDPGMLRRDSLLGTEVELGFCDGNIGGDDAPEFIWASANDIDASFE
jgi:hypothetical protein